MRHPIVIPDLGATGGDVRIVSWAVKEGQTVKEGETLFTVETDKAVTEIPCFSRWRVGVDFRRRRTELCSRRGGRLPR